MSKQDNETELPHYECVRCDHRWIPRKTGKPRICPGCKSAYWDTPKVEKPKATAESVSTTINGEPIDAEIDVEFENGTKTHTEPGDNKKTPKKSPAGKGRGKKKGAAKGKKKPASNGGSVKSLPGGGPPIADFDPESEKITPIDLNTPEGKLTKRVIENIADDKDFVPVINTASSSMDIDGVLTAIVEGEPEKVTLSVKTDEIKLDKKFTDALPSDEEVYAAVPELRDVVKAPAIKDGKIAYPEKKTTAPPPVGIVMEAPGAGKEKDDNCPNCGKNAWYVGSDGKQCKICKKTYPLE